MRALFAHRGFRQLMIGQVVSSLGDWLGTIALIALVLDLSGSSTAVGGVLVLRLAPSLVAGPLVTRLVGRWNRRRMMLAMDAVRLVVVVLIPLVGALWWVYVWAFVLEAAGLVFLPARDAAIPDLIEDGDLSLANGLVLGSSYGTIPIGAALFGLAGVVAAGRTGIALAFFLDAVTFGVSYLLIRPIRELDAPQQPGDVETTTGFLAAFRIPFVRAFAPATVIATLGLGTLFSVGIVFVRDVLDASTGQFGVLIALFGVGAAVGLVLLRFLGRDPVRVVRYGLGAQGIVIATMSLAPTLAFAFLGAALFGAATSTTLTASMSAVQELLPDKQRVIGFAAFHVLIRVGLSLSAIGAGIAADLILGVRWPLVGHLPPSRVVLLGAGVFVVVGAALLAPLLRTERFTVGAAPEAREPSIDLTLIAIEDEPRDERPASITGDGAIPGDPLDQHRNDDRGTRPRVPSTADAPEERHHHEIGGQAADRGLATEPTRYETAEQRHRAGPRLGQHRSDRG
jgi:MFS family permease